MTITKLLSQFSKQLAGLVIVLACSASVARAGIMIEAGLSTTTQPHSGAFYENFNSLPTGNAGGLTGTGIAVSFVPSSPAPVDAQVVTGTVSGSYAEPVVHDGNDANFGSTANYLTTGTVGSSVTLTFPGVYNYMGLLWGSVDQAPADYNQLEFFNGSTSVGVINGEDVAIALFGSPTGPNGDQTATGTYYVNIITTGVTTFDRVVATGSRIAFEFDNVAFNSEPPHADPNVPEPASLAIWGLGALGLAAVRARRKK